MTNASIFALEQYLGFLFCSVLSGFRKMALVLGGGGAENETSKKIVFVKFIEQGALVLHKNTFSEAARQYGAENVFLCTFLSNAQLVDVLDVFPAENRVFINEKSLWQFTKSFAQAIFKIRKRHIDSAIDLEFFSRATAIFCYLTGAAKRAGYHRYKGLQNYRGDLFTHRLSYSHYVHLSDSSWSLLKSLELPVESLPALDITLNSQLTEVSFNPNPVDLERLEKLLGYRVTGSDSLIVINPSLNDVLPLRRWPEEHYKTFIHQFKDRFPHYRIVFTGRGDEFALTENFIASLAITGAVNLCGKTELSDILTLYTQSKLLLTSDSGPAHFAVLTPVNTIVLFGPETPVLYAPLSKRTKVLYNPPPCSPCYNVYNNRLSACGNNICMQRISVSEVMKAAEEILA
jgi:ADP-heptose:LPS heptosyltransferase